MHELEGGHGRCNARLAPSLLGDPLLMGSYSCMSSVCSFKALADASGHDRHNCPFQPSEGQDTSSSLSWPQCPWGISVAKTEEVNTWQSHMSEV